MEQQTLKSFFSSPRASTLSSQTRKELGIIDSNGTPQRTRKARTSKVKTVSGSGENLTQTILDAGQKIGLDHCLKCGMVYNQGVKKDVEDHNIFHNRFTERHNFRVTAGQIDAWKKFYFQIENLITLSYEEVQSPVVGVIFNLKAVSTSSLKRKFDEIIRQYVDVELGFNHDVPIWDEAKTRQAFVFVANPEVKKEPAFIAGVILVETIDRAILMPQKKPFVGIFIGIDRIWVHSQMRRKGLATVLLEYVRSKMTENQQKLPRSRMAFGDPTESGVALAISYVGDKENGRYIIYTTALRTAEHDKIKALEKRMEI